MQERENRNTCFPLLLCMISTKVLEDTSQSNRKLGKWHMMVLASHQPLNCYWAIVFALFLFYLLFLSRWMVALILWILKWWWPLPFWNNPLWAKKRIPWDHFAVMIIFNLFRMALRFIWHHRAFPSMYFSLSWPHSNIFQWQFIKLYCEMGLLRAQLSAQWKETFI